MIIFELTPNCLEAADNSMPQLLRNMSSKMLDNEQMLQMLEQLFEAEGRPVQVKVSLKRDQAE